jgi:membrane protease YdiL (CAAX protease family)
MSVASPSQVTAGTQPSPPRYRLDEELERDQFGRLPLVLAFAAVAGIFALQVVSSVAVHAWDAPRAVVALVGEILMGLIAFAASLPILRSAGTRAVGLHAPQRTDLRVTGTWAGIQLLARYGVTIVLIAAMPSLAHHGLSNLRGVRPENTAGVVLIAVAAIVIAPIAEELMFRGLLLRTLAARTSFWPAAITSSVLFGALHAQGGSTVAAAIALSVVMTVFGLVQCLLVRRTARLTPAIYVHALLNALAIAITLAGVTGPR